MQIYPMGINNLNQLVQYQLGETGYLVVKEVYENMDLFKKLGRIYSDNTTSKPLIDYYRKSKLLTKALTENNKLLDLYRKNKSGTNNSNVPNVPNVP